MTNPLPGWRVIRPEHQPTVEAPLPPPHPRPGTDAHEKLDLLRVIGGQDLTPAR